MYEIKVIDEFSGAHNLRNYKGKCEELHGHNWKVEVTVCKNTLNAQGMIMDFKDLKNALKRILSLLDHKYLNDIPSFGKKNPTSENIAEFIYKKLSAKIKNKILVTVWETENSSASFYK